MKRQDAEGSAAVGRCSGPLLSLLLPFRSSATCRAGRVSGSPKPGLIPSPRSWPALRRCSVAACGSSPRIRSAALKSWRMESACSEQLGDSAGAGPVHQQSWKRTDAPRRSRRRSERLPPSCSGLYGCRRSAGGSVGAGKCRRSRAARRELGCGHRSSSAGRPTILPNGRLPWGMPLDCSSCPSLIRCAATGSPPSTPVSVHSSTSGTTGWSPEWADIVDVVARLSGELRRFHTAAQLHGAVRLAGVPPTRRSRTRRRCAALLQPDRVRRQLGQRAWTDLYAAGGRLDMEEATELAVAVLDDAAQGTRSLIHRPLATPRSRFFVSSPKDSGDAEIANRLTLSRRTVQAHLRSIYLKLNVTSRTAAVRAAHAIPGMSVVD